MNAIRRLFLVLALAAALAPLLAPAPAVAAGPAPLWPVALEAPFPGARDAFEEVRRLILERYYSATIDEDALMHAAILGMLRLVSPPQNRELAKLWRPAQYEQVADALKGRGHHAGIRSTLNAADGSLTVNEVLPGSPAEKLLRPQDRILRIDGARLGGRSAAEIDALLNGAEGATIRFTVVRDIEVLEIPVVLRPFKLSNLRWSELPGRIGYVDIDRVTLDISKELAEAIAALQGRGVTGAVIDLRGNQGGLFVEGLRLAELFLPKQAVLVRVVQHGGAQKNYVSANAAPLRLPLVLLVDRDTASSAEIFAAALRAGGLARLVGTPTHGKATLEETFRLANDWRVKFVVGAMYDGTGQSWHARGLLPDLSVALDAGARTAAAKLAPVVRLERDAQLKAAWSLLK